MVAGYGICLFAGVSVGPTELTVWGSAWWRRIVRRSETARTDASAWRPVVYVRGSVLLIEDGQEGFDWRVVAERAADVRVAVHVAWAQDEAAAKLKGVLAQLVLAVAG